jgi:tetratricopeptide (TPR) repeat protein
MFKGFAVILTAAGLTMAANAAWADTGSVSILGSNAVKICSDHARSVTEGGRVSRQGLEACDDAIKHVALSDTELAASYVNRGVIHLAIGNAAAAVGDDNAALQIQPNLTDALINRGAAFAAQKRFADAIGDFDRALALSPRHPEWVYYNRGMAHEDLGELKSAYLDYLKASQLAPGWAQPKTELARFTVAKPAQG